MLVMKPGSQAWSPRYAKASACELQEASAIKGYWLASARRLNAQAVPWDGSLQLLELFEGFKES